MFLQCGKKFEKYFSLDVKGFPVPFSINSKHVSKFSTWAVTYDVEISRTVFTHDNYKKKCGRHTNFQKWLENVK